MLRRFCVFLRYMIFRHFSLLVSLSFLHLFFLSSSLLFSSPWSSVVSVVVVSSLDDMYLPHGMARLGHVELVVARRQRSIAHQLAHQSVFERARNPLPRGPLDFHPLRVWETALGDRQLTSQLELRAMIVRTVSALDQEAAEKACTTGFIHRCLSCVRARGGHLEHRLSWTNSRARVCLWSRSTSLETRTKESNR